MSRSEWKHVGVPLGLVLVLGGAGCATKGYVNDRVETLRQDTDQELAGTRSDLAALRNTTEEAAARAGTASEAASQARDLALGKVGLEELNRYTVRFAFDSDELASGETAVLDRAADEIRSHPEVIVDVYGFADPLGPDRYNLELGQRRAMEVLRYLAEVAPNQLSKFAAVSYGERPLRGMETPAADRSEQRRVVVSLIRRIPPGESAPPRVALSERGAEGGD